MSHHFRSNMVSVGLYHNSVIEEERRVFHTEIVLCVGLIHFWFFEPARVISLQANVQVWPT